MRYSEEMATMCHSRSIQNDAFRPEVGGILSWIRVYDNRIVVGDYPGLRFVHPVSVSFCRKEEQETHERWI